MPQEGVGGGWRGLEGQEGRVGGACQLAGGGRRASASCRWAAAGQRVAGETSSSLLPPTRICRPRSLLSSQSMHVPLASAGGALCFMGLCSMSARGWVGEGG